MMKIPITVSYTHLDVYKRQIPIALLKQIKASEYLPWSYNAEPLLFHGSFLFGSMAIALS